MPTERDAGVDELAELRRRAYGPNADIAADPVAQARLHELEAVEREAHSIPEFTGGAISAYAAPDPVSATAEKAPVLAVHADPAHADGDGSGADQDSLAQPAAPWTASSSASSSAAVAEGARGTRPLRSPRKWMPWLIAVVAGAVAVAAVVALVGGEFSRPRPEQSLPVRTLPSTVAKPDLSEPMRQVWGIPDAPVSYRGTLGRLDIWTTTDRSQWDCILLSTLGQIYRASCSHRPLPAMVDFVTDNTTFPPESLDPVIPVGSFLRLMWAGDVLDVYVARLAEGDVPGALTVR